jgi:REP element-mobilizing transposase RayT
MSGRIADSVHNAWFLTLTVVDWIDIFTRQAYRDIFTDGLNYAVDNKGMELYAWVLMSNHAHLVASAQEGYNLSDMMRDMNKHTSKKIVAEVQAIPESRAEWMLHRFAYAGKYDSHIKNYRFWQEGSYPKECYSTPFLRQKVDYVHLNSVRAGIVAEPEHYLYSSAIDYAGGKGLVKVSVIDF